MLFSAIKMSKSWEQHEIIDNKLLSTDNSVAGIFCPIKKRHYWRWLEFPKKITAKNALKNSSLVWSTHVQSDFAVYFDEFREFWTLKLEKYVQMTICVIFIKKREILALCLEKIVLWNHIFFDKKTLGHFSHAQPWPRG